MSKQYPAGTVLSATCTMQFHSDGSIYQSFKIGNMLTTIRMRPDDPNTDKLRKLIPEPPSKHLPHIWHGSLATPGKRRIYGE